ncbi:MAG: SDR family oxidoreductase, partial [Planctomycetes bacterium]|nr:SDR family oxidoreductase [Planctomycetota bacterium]
MDFLQLTGKSILVFGVANRKSVAYHVARVLEAAGAKVVYVVRSQERRQAVAGLLAPEAEIYVCDVERQQEIDRLRDEISRKHDRFHGLVHSIAFAEYAD